MIQLAQKDILKLPRHVIYQIHQKNPFSEVEVLLLNAIAVVDLELGNIEKSLKYFSTAKASLHFIENKSENLNVINYQYGLALYNLNKYYDALDVLLSGLNRVMSLESYFMLPEYVLMIMNCYQRLGDVDSAKKYKARYDAYSDMYSVELAYIIMNERRK